MKFGNLLNKEQLATEVAACFLPLHPQGSNKLKLLDIQNFNP